MKTENITGEIAEFQGRKDWPGFSFPIKFETVVELFENVGELRAAGAFPNDQDILDMVNGKRKASSKAKAYQEKTKDLKSAYENSADYKRKNLIDAALSAGFTQAEAEALAAQKLG